MTYKMKEYMIHETLESGRVITQVKGHDQELIVTLTSSKGSVGNVFFFHTDLVVSKKYIKFNKVLNIYQFI
jgi:hypothetical protein